MSNGKGLKGQWGVGDPAKAGSDKQSQQFQASFQKELAAINGHLQYTSANADAARHDPLAARRDALYPAFQAALAQIDRTNPAKAQGAIDKVLADGKALCSESATLHKAAEKALNDWKARQPKYDAAVHQVEELEAWGDPKAPAVRGLLDGVRTQTNQRTYAQAVLVVDQLLPKLKPLHDDYQKHKAAKPKYEQALAEQSARLDALKAAERPSQPMTAKAAEADTALQAARAKADAKDFVGGDEQMKAVRTAADALDKLAKDPQRAKFLADRPTVEDAVNHPGDTTFQSLEADWNAIHQQRQQMDPAADSGDYAGANKMLADLKVKFPEFQKKLEDLTLQKRAYDEVLAVLQPRLSEVSKSQYTKLDAMQQDMIAVQTQMETAAQSENYTEAVKFANDLSTKVDAYATAFGELEQQQKEYDDILAALQPRLLEVSQSQYAKLDAMQQEMIAVQGQMEAAAQSEDYPQAVTFAQDLSTKVDAYATALAEAQKEEQDYTAARTALKPKLANAFVSARQFASLAADRTALVAADGEVETAASAHDFRKALELVKALETKVDAYLTKSKTEEDKYKKKGEDVAKQLDGASDATRGDVAKAAANGLSDDELQHLPSPIRNRLLEEMQKGGLTDDEKTASKKLFSKKFLDPEFEKLDDESRKKMIDKMKNDPDFKKARDNWNTITEAERVAIMKKAVDYQAEAYDIPKTPIETYSKDDAGDYGFFRRSDGKLHINVHDAALKNGGFDEAIDTAVHENGHRYQTYLIEQLEAGKIKPGDALYNQATTFKLNSADRTFYVQPPGDTPSVDTGDEYFTQPKEHHSRRTGTEVQNAGIGK